MHKYAQKMRQIKVYVCGVSECAREKLNEQLQYCKRVIQNADLNAVLDGIKHEYKWLRVATTTRTPLNAVVLVEPPPDELEVLQERAEACNDLYFWADERTLELQKAIYEKEYKEMGGEEEKQ